MTDTADTILLTGSEQEQPVLVAIDFSEDSKAALLWARNFAECSSAPLILLHIVHDLASNPGFYHPENSNHLEPMQDVAELMMTEFLDRLKIEHPELCSVDDADLQFIPGLPPTRIVEVAELLSSSLIVIGARGMTGPLDKRLGSVAQRVVELSPIPVVVIKSETHGVLKKKERKRREKRKKKDRKKLKDLLGISHKPASAEGVDE